MIRRLVVSNFRSLGDDVALEFEPLTVLVGQNGSGKSNVVDTLHFVSDAMSMGLSGAITDRHGISAIRRWSNGRPYNLAVHLDLDLDGAQWATYHFELKGDRAEEYSVKTEEAVISTPGGPPSRFRIESGSWIEGPRELRPRLDAQSLALPLLGGDVRFQPLLRQLQDLAVYTIFPETLRVPQKYSPVKPMDRYGSNWASILKDQPAESWKPDLLAVLQRLTGDIEDIRVVPAASYLVVQFRHDAPDARKKWFNASQESDGTLRVAGIVTALLQEPTLPVLAFEEPELTVHPGAISLLYDYLVQAGRRSQIIVTTHSPELLDLLDADAVRVVQRIGGATRISRMALDQKGSVREGLLTLGDVLRTEGFRAEQLTLPMAG